MCFAVLKLYTNVLRSTRISRKSAALIVRYSQKKKWLSIVFYCYKNPSIAHNLWTTGPIQVGFSAKCTSLSEHFNQTENWKCRIHVRAPTDPARSHHKWWMQIMNFETWKILHIMNMEHNHNTWGIFKIRFYKNANLGMFSFYNYGIFLW